MTETLNIALVSRYYPPDPGGGLAIYTHQIAQALAGLGHQVQVIAARPQSAPWEATLPDVQDHDGVRLVRVPQLKIYARSLFGTTCLYNSAVIAQTLREIHQTRPIDLIHCPATFFESYYYGRFIKPRLNIPLIVKFHENQETYQRIDGHLKWLKRLRRERLKGFIRQAALDADAHLGVSRHALDSMNRYLGLQPDNHPAWVSPSPIDLDLFYPRTESPPPDVDYDDILRRNIPFIFYSGRLITEKGLHLLVDAFLSIVSESHPDLHLVVAGEFDYRQPHYEAQIRRMLDGHAAASRVIFTGRMAYREMPWWYSQCRLFVGPSFCEPLGRVFLEAMACQAPVVAFNAGGPQEFIRHEQNGFLINTQAVWSLGHALRNLLDNPEFCHQLGIMGRRTVEAEYSLKSVTQDLLECYTKLCDPTHLRQYKHSPYAKP